jgi:hypothetical protein
VKRDRLRCQKIDIVIENITDSMRKSQMATSIEYVNIMKYMVKKFPGYRLFFDVPLKNDEVVTKLKDEKIPYLKRTKISNRSISNGVILNFDKTETLSFSPHLHTKKVKYIVNRENDMWGILFDLRYNFPKSFNLDNPQGCIKAINDDLRIWQKPIIFELKTSEKRSYSDVVETTNDTVSEVECNVTIRRTKRLRIN